MSPDKTNIAFTIPLEKRQQCLNCFKQGYGYKKTAYLVGLNTYAVREYSRQYKAGDTHWADGQGIVVDREPANKYQGTVNTLKNITSSIASIDYSSGLRLDDYMTFKSFVASVDEMISDRVAFEFVDRIVEKQLGLTSVSEEIKNRINQHNDYGRKYDIEYPYIRSSAESFHMIVETRCITPSACQEAFDRNQIRLINRDIKALASPAVRKRQVYEDDDYSSYYRFLAMMYSGDYQEAVASLLSKWNEVSDNMQCEFLSPSASVSELSVDRIYVAMIEVSKDMILVG